MHIYELIKAQTFLTESKIFDQDVIILMFCLLNNDRVMFTSINQEAGQLCSQAN